MKTVRFIFIAATTILLSMLAMSSALAASPTLTGHWTAVDPIDEDTVHMTLSGGHDGVYNLKGLTFMPHSRV